MKHTKINNYCVDESGNVLNKTTGLYLKAKFNKWNGYNSVALCENGKIKNLYIHRLVAIFFIPNPENKKDVNHINGIKTDNRLENLEWATRSENIVHSFKLGLSNTRGIRNSKAKLTEKQVIEIREKILNGLRDSEICKPYCVHKDTIRSIRNLKNWSHI